jgi:hypothetical protein
MKELIAFAVTALLLISAGAVACAGRDAPEARTAVLVQQG